MGFFVFSAETWYKISYVNTMKITGILIVLATLACNTPAKQTETETVISATTVYEDTSKPISNADTPQIANEAKIPVENIPQVMTTVTRQELVSYAKTLMGVPYKYASTNPSVGFDCSGFITYVFNHFNIEVPRSSVDFTNVGKEVDAKNAMEGDLILFTGTNDSIRIVGHMGIVTENADTLKFIHSSSGKAMGVTISDLGTYYSRRFVKVVRVFPD